MIRRARPRQDSNLRTRLRRPVLYPLSYEGSDPILPYIAGAVRKGAAGRGTEPPTAEAPCKRRAGVLF